MIQIGLILNITGEKERTDKEVIQEHYALGDLAEPLGFNSLFILEHHFTNYVLSPSPFQTLAYYAGRTSRIKLGTAVAVLPWHSPIQIAEQISVLDIMCNGRCLLCFGRGAGISEFRGFGISMTESRARFKEATEIIVGCLTTDQFKYEGHHYKIPEVSIRPKSNIKPEEHFYGSSMSDDSSNFLAQLGFGMLISTETDWSKLGIAVNRFQQAALASGYLPKAPLLVTKISVAPTREEAFERAFKYIEQDLSMVDAHYQFSTGHLRMIEGYESYDKTEQFFLNLTGENFGKTALADYLKLQIIGTPDDCIQQIEHLCSITGAEHLVLEFCYGGLPCKEAENSMKLCASTILKYFNSQLKIFHPNAQEIQN